MKVRNLKRRGREAEGETSHVEATKERYPGVTLTVRDNTRPTRELQVLSGKGNLGQMKGVGNKEL